MSFAGMFFSYPEIRAQQAALMENRPMPVLCYPPTRSGTAALRPLKPRWNSEDGLYWGDRYLQHVWNIASDRLDGAAPILCNVTLVANHVRKPSYIGIYDCETQGWTRYLRSDGVSYYWKNIDGTLLFERYPGLWRHYWDPRSRRMFWQLSEDEWFFTSRNQYPEPIHAPMIHQSQIATYPVQPRTPPPPPPYPTPPLPPPQLTPTAPSAQHKHQHPQQQHPEQQKFPVPTTIPMARQPLSPPPLPPTTPLPPPSYPPPPTVPPIARWF